MPNNTKKTFERVFKKNKLYLMVIAIVLVLLCIQNKIYIIPSVITYGLLIAYTFWRDNKNKSELDKHIQELTFNMDTIAKNTLVNSPFPIVIVNTKGDITWKSVKFVNEFGNTDIKNMLADLTKTLKSEMNNNRKDIFTSEQIKIGKKDYKVIAQKLNEKSNKRKKNPEAFAMYIIDNTELLEAT